MFPIHNYPHDFSIGGCSVTGGFVYRGTENPGLVGRYFFTDFCTGLIWTLRKDEAGEWVHELIHEGNSNDYSTFGENAVGELFIAGLITGKIYKIVEQCVLLSVVGTTTDETCEGEADGAINLELTGAMPMTIQWSNGETTGSITGLAAGDYTVTVTDATNCEKEYSFTIQNSSPEMPTLQMADDFLSVDDIFATYQWYLDGEALVDSTSVTIYFSQSGDYSLEVSNEAGCFVFSDVVTVVVENTFYPEGIQRAALIPNPVNDYVNIVFESTESMAVLGRIIDIRGKVIRSFDMVINDVTNRRISTEELKSGLYFVIFNTNKGSFTKKLIKQ